MLELRRRATGIHFAVLGVPATVVRPAPDNTPIETRCIWVTPGDTQPISEAYPSGGSLQRREPGRIMALPLSDVITLPIGTLITAADQAGADARTWRLDATLYGDPDHRRVYVVPED
jgi:hypothetical protein